ncbi:MAG: RidA family protein [Elusimicrobia bacterium]|nr:RidA family protein [Elusimicrobiota bacterium]
MRRNIPGGAPWEPVVGYSRAVRVGNHIWVAGTTGIDLSGKVVAGGAYAQTKRAIQNIETALKKAGAGLKDVVQTRLYTTDISLWKQIGRAHGEAFRDIRPACAMLGIKSLIDRKMVVEIEAVACLGGKRTG